MFSTILDDEYSQLAPQCEAEFNQDPPGDEKLRVRVDRYSLTPLAGGPDDNIASRHRPLSVLLSSRPPEMLTCNQRGARMATFGSAQTRTFLER